MNFRDLVELARQRPLTEAEAAAAMALMADGVPPAGEIRDFLLTPAMSVEEVAAPTLTGLARVVRERAVPVPGIASAFRFDTCGTGGGASTFNISTTAAFVLAAAPGVLKRPELSGLVVAKHGNRAVASKTGSADVLEQLGVRIDLEPADNVRVLNETGFAFFFAQKYHRAFAHVMPVRKALAAEGRRTAFNLIGPLANPAGVSHQLVGVFVESRLRVVVEVLRSLGATAVMAVTGRTESGEAMDELSLSGPTRVVWLKDGVINEFTLEPADFGLAAAPVETLSGAGPAEAAAAVRAVLAGSDPDSPRSRATALKAAAALQLAGCGDGQTCAAMATEVIASGAALKLVERVASRSHPNAT